MSTGHTNRRTVLKTSAVAILAGLGGCTGAVSSRTGGETEESEPQTEWDFVRYLPTQSLGRDGEFVLTRPAAVRRDQTDIGAKKSAQILKRTVGKSAWIPDHEIDNQVIWDGQLGQGYAFETSLTKSEVVSRYENSYLRETPVGSYDDYALFRRSSSWHAVSENDVIKIPTRDRADVTSYIDALERERSPNSDMQLILDEFDSRYSLDVTLFASYPRQFHVSDIEYQGRCFAVSPNPDTPGFTLSVGIVSDSPTRIAEWAREREYVFIENRKLSPSTVRISDGVVFLEDTGTVASFDGYR